MDRDQGRNSAGFFIPAPDKVTVRRQRCMPIIGMDDVRLPVDLARQFKCREREEGIFLSIQAVIGRVHGAAGSNGIAIEKVHRHAIQDSFIGLYLDFRPAARDGINTYRPKRIGPDHGVMRQHQPYIEFDFIIGKCTQSTWQCPRYITQSSYFYKWFSFRSEE